MVSVFKDVDVSEWTFSDVKVNARGGKSVYINNASGGRIMPIQIACDDDEELPRAIFGITSPPGTNISGDRKNMCISLPSDELRTFLNNIDNLIVAEAKAKKWLGNIPEPEYATRYHRLVAGNNLTPYMRTKIGVRYVKVYIAENTIGTIADVAPKTSIIPIVNILPIWFYEGKYGVSIECTHILIQKNDMEDFIFLTKNPMECTNKRL